MNKIGKILKQERLKNNLTLQALSNISNISISILSKMENDKIRNVSSVYLYRLSNILDMNYEYLTKLKWDIFLTFLYERNHKFASK